MLFAGHFFQYAPDKKQPEHVVKKMEKTIVQKDVGKNRPGLIRKEMPVGHEHQCICGRGQKETD